MNEREIKWMAPFGPVIMESTISDELFNILTTRGDQLREGRHPNPEINTKTNDYRSRLAGCLSEEYSYRGAFTEEEDAFVEAELTFLAAHYTMAAHKASKVKKNAVRDANQIIMQKPLWVNYMKSGEWNPSHSPYSTGGYIRTPVEKSIFFFPAALSHMVYPFKADTERVSMSVNFDDRIDLEQALKQDGERGKKEKL